MNLRPLALFATLALLAPLSGLAQSTNNNTAPKSTKGATSRAVVYRLQFTPDGDSINFRNYTNAYYLADIPLSSTSGGTLILTQVVGGVRTFYTYEDFGGMFIAVKGSEKKGIMVGTRTSASTTASATTTTGYVQNLTLYAIGKPDEQTDAKNPAIAGENAKTVFPNKLEGTAIFVDSQEDFPFAYVTGENFGSAGVMKLTAEFSEGLSAGSLERNMVRNELVQMLWEQLVAQGFVNASAPTSGSTAGTGTTGTGTSGR